MKLLLMALTLLLLPMFTNAQQNLTRLTNHPDLDGYPVFSPDGQKIFFHSTRSTSDHRIAYSSIWSMNVDGSDQKEIIRIDPPLSSGTLVPTVCFVENQNHLIFKEVNNIWEFFKVDLSKIQQYPLKRKKKEGSEGLFEIVLTVFGGFSSSSVIHSTTTDELFWVTGRNYGKYNIRKANLSDLNGQNTATAGTSIFNTSNQGLITLNDSHPIGLSPDGTRLVVAMIIDTNGCNSCRKDLYILDSGSGAIIKRLTTDGLSKVNHEDPWWSPDGEWILYYSNKGGKNSIWVIRADGTDEQQLTSGNYTDYKATWSPDSKKIAFTSTRDGNQEIYIMDFQSDCDELAFTYPDFSNTDDLLFVDRAFQSQKTVTLTPASPWKGGAIWHEDMMPVKKGFTTEFAFKFSDGENKYEYEEYPGADGIAFIIQNSSNDVIGDYGGGMGYSGIENSLIVEFDTYKNHQVSMMQDNLNDPNANHVAVFSNQSNAAVADHHHPSNLLTIELDDILPIIPNDVIYYCKMEYDYEELKLTLFLDTTDNFETPLFVLPNIDLSERLDLEEGEYAWVGFTSATGIAFEKHELLSWSFCPKPTEVFLTDIEELSIETEKIYLYPNPTDSELIIETTNKNEIIQKIQIFDIYGRNVVNVDKFNTPGLHTLNLDNFSIGNYQVVVTTSSNIYRNKVVVVK